jgi:hypothetical protein
MPNHIRGDSKLAAGNQQYTLRLTLGALAEIEDALGVASLGEIATRLKTLATADIAAVASALLRGGGHNLSTADVLALDCDLGSIVRAIAGAFTAAGLGEQRGDESEASASSAAPRESNFARGDAERQGMSKNPLAGAASSNSRSA